MKAVPLRRLVAVPLMVLATQVLSAIYAHLDGTTTVGTSSPSTRGASADAHRQDEWGRAVRHSPRGRPILFERELGNGVREFTWVVWAEETATS